MKANNLIALNTAVIYVRIVISTITTLLSTRWVLLALGKEDFGIYNLVAGLLAMLMFLNISMTSASQRFLSYALGKNDGALLKDTFYYSVVFHFFTGLIVLVLIESVGVALLQYVLIIPEGKNGLAMFCLHSLSISTFFTVLTVPYNAVLLSHENVLFVSLVQIGESFVKLFISIVLLIYIGNRLKLYAVGITLVPIISGCIYVYYCYRNYNEVRLKIKGITNKPLLKSFVSFASWDMIGATSRTLRTQGVSMLLNSFYGVAINAAYGISTQVNGQISFLSSAIITAARPQIVKSEGEGNRERSLAIAAMMCKSSFLLLCLFSIPLIIEMPFLLRIWLKEVPEYTISFTRLVVITCLVLQLSMGVSIPIDSVGKNKMMQIIAGGMHFIVLPIGYLMLRLGMSPEMIFILIIIEESIAIYFRLLISHRVTGLVISDFVRYTLAPCVTIFVVVYLGVKLSISMLDVGFVRLMIDGVLSFVLIIPLSYYYAFTNIERHKLNEIIVSFMNKQF